MSDFVKSKRLASLIGSQNYGSDMIPTESSTPLSRRHLSTATGSPCIAFPSKRMPLNSIQWSNIPRFSQSRPPTPAS
jgi:hypothetical protein